MSVILQEMYKKILIYNISNFKDILYLKKKITKY